MKTTTSNQKKVFNKKGNKINLSNYLSKIISLKDIKLDSKNSQNKKINELSEVLSENQSKLLAEKEEEIKTLKLRCEKLQEENKKYQFQKNINKENTSSNFPLKKEIKELWEKFARIDILNNFIDFENEPEIIYHIISEMFLLSSKLIKEKSENKYKEIIRVMGIKNNSMNIKDIGTQFKNFIKEHLNEIFKDLEANNFINEYKEKIKNIFKDNILKEKNNITNKDELIKIFSEILEQSDFNEIIKDINNLVLIAQYNEPSLLFNIEPNIKNRKIRLIKIKNKKNYIIPNDNTNKNIYYLIILNPPEIKNGIYYFNDLKQILMPITSNYSDNSKIIKEEEEIIDISNNDNNTSNNNINTHILSNSFSQKGINNKKYKLTNNSEEKNNIIAIDKKMINSLRVYTLRESNEKKIKNMKKIDKGKFFLYKNYEKYWRLMNDENSNFFDNYDKIKNNNYKMINISNEKTKKKQIAKYINNKRRKNSLKFNVLLNSDKKGVPSFNSEDTIKTKAQRKLNETENIKNKNKIDLVNSLKGATTIKNITKSYLRNSKKNIKINNNYIKNQLNPKKQPKNNLLNITNENKKININKLIKSHQKIKIGNLYMGEDLSNRTLENGNNNKDIKCKIKNFNINYINIENNGKILGLNNTNIYNHNKLKLTKENNIYKNNYIYLPIDDIQKIIETNVNKQRLKSCNKNIRNDYYNKIANKKIINHKKYINSSMQKKLTWVNKDNSMTLNNIKNNSNNITQRHLNKRSKTNLYFSNYIYSKNKKANVDNKKYKKKLNNFRKIKANTINNNIEEYSQINSTINSAKKTNNNKTNHKTSEKIFKKKLYKNIINNIELDIEEKTPVYFKIKNNKINLKNNSERKNNLNNYMNIRLGKVQVIKNNKKINISKNEVNSNLYSDNKNKNINSTSNILNNK